MLNIVLVEPEIPPNTGNIARLCAAMELTLHLVKPLGFSIDDKSLKRAGLDYWDEVDVIYHHSFQHFLENTKGGSYYYLTTKTNRPYTLIQFKKNDYLIFGPETRGLKEELLKANPQQCLTIPMTGKVRSLNLATSVAMVCGEALRQIKNEST